MFMRHMVINVTVVNYKQIVCVVKTTHTSNARVENVLA